MAAAVRGFQHNLAESVRENLVYAALIMAVALFETRAC